MDERKVPGERVPPESWTLKIDGVLPSPTGTPAVRLIGDGRDLMPERLFLDATGTVILKHFFQKGTLNQGTPAFVRRKILALWGWYNPSALKGPLPSGDGLTSGCPKPGSIVSAYSPRLPWPKSGWTASSPSLRCLGGKSTFRSRSLSSPSRRSAYRRIWRRPLGGQASFAHRCRSPL